MEKLLDAIAAIVRLVPPEKVHAIASRIRNSNASNADSSLSGVVSTPAASAVVIQLIAAWRESKIGSDELASMLLAADRVFTNATSMQSIQLVLTGPVTPFVSTRRTEQALLEVINSAEKTLFITSFVAYDVSSIVNALNNAAANDVKVSMLLEQSHDQGGSITFDAVGRMKTLIPAADLYTWQDKEGQYSQGRVHAKVAVADGKMCFITSANLTGYAMEKNMEAGVLITGGILPAQLINHLQALVEHNVIVPVQSTS